MILDYTFDNDKYIAKLIAEQASDQIIDLNELINSGEKASLFSERPYVLVADYNRLLNLKTLFKMGKTVTEGSKIIYCIFVTDGKRSYPLNMAKNICAVKGGVLFGCESFLRGKRNDEAALLKAKQLGSCVRDSVPFEVGTAIFPMRFAGKRK
ncbi:MAG: hypothetical protein IJW13_05385 [Clostridia bacterium]|nr:hypothetical protein [Clostridia bacterium]